MTAALVLAGSLIAVLALALAAKLLGLGVAPRLEGRDDAIRRARDLHFEAVDAVLEGDGALLIGARGERARLRPHGNHFVIADA